MTDTQPPETPPSEESAGPRPFWEASALHPKDHVRVLAEHFLRHRRTHTAEALGRAALEAGYSHEEVVAAINSVDAGLAASEASAPTRKTAQRAILAAYGLTYLLFAIVFLTRPILVRDRSHRAHHPHRSPRFGSRPVRPVGPPPCVARAWGKRELRGDPVPAGRPPSSRRRHLRLVRRSRASGSRAMLALRPYTPLRMVLTVCGHCFSDDPDREIDYETDILQGNLVSMDGQVTCAVSAGAATARSSRCTRRMPSFGHPSSNGGCRPARSCPTGRPTRLPSRWAMPTAWASSRPSTRASCCSTSPRTAT